MDKVTVIKALEICASEEGCEACPYYKERSCDKSMAKDIIALLKANDKPTYHTAVIYTKRDNLLSWYEDRPDINHTPSIREHYAREREIQLILLVRHEEGKCICRIKCPINPLPIKGEFQCVSTSEMTRLLTSMGWTYKEKVHSAMFK